MLRILHSIARRCAVSSTLSAQWALAVSVFFLQSVLRSLPSLVVCSYAEKTRLRCTWPLTLPFLFSILILQVIPPTSSVLSPPPFSASILPFVVADSATAISFSPPALLEHSSDLASQLVLISPKLQRSRATRSACTGCQQIGEYLKFTGEVPLKSLCLERQRLLDHKDCTLRPLSSLAYLTVFP